MSITTPNSNNLQKEFDKVVAREWFNGDPLSKLEGTGNDSIIKMVRCKSMKSMPYIAGIGGAGVNTNQTLEGNEVPIANNAFEIATYERANGTISKLDDNRKTAFSLSDEHNAALVNWSKEWQQGRKLQALLGIHNAGLNNYYQYGGMHGSLGSENDPTTIATAGQLDSWNALHPDGRIVYGAATSNYVSGDHTGSLLNVDSTNDTLTVDSLEYLCDIAQGFTTQMRPAKTKKDGVPYWIYVCGTKSYRSLMRSLRTYYTNARERSEDNPLFSRLAMPVWNSVGILCVPHLDHMIDSAYAPISQTNTFVHGGSWGAGAAADDLRTAGNGSTRVAPGFFLGAGALVHAVYEQPTIRPKKKFDYGRKEGTAISFVDGFKKAYYQDRTYGIITHFHSAV